MPKRSKSTIAKPSVLIFLLLTVIIFTYFPYWLIHNDPLWYTVQTGLFDFDNLLGLGFFVGDLIALFGIFIFTGFLLAFSLSIFRKELVPQRNNREA